MSNHRDFQGSGHLRVDRLKNRFLAVAARVAVIRSAVKSHDQKGVVHTDRSARLSTEWSCRGRPVRYLTVRAAGLETAPLGLATVTASVVDEADGRISVTFNCVALTKVTLLPE